MFKTLALTSTLLLLAGPAIAADFNGSEICIGPFALCADAQCTEIPGNSTHANCTCLGPFNDLNTGKSSCQARTESLISTYSIINRFTSPTQPPIYSFPCTGANAGPWVQCIDAPCSTETGAVVCTCRLQPKGDFHYFGETCPATAAETKKLCSTLRSASGFSNDTSSTNSSLESRAAASSKSSGSGDFLGTFYGNPPNKTTCNPPGA